MIWLTWRQFRTAAIAVFGVLAAFAVALALTGPGVAGDYASGIASCTAQGGDCERFLRNFFNDYQGVFLAVTAVILVLPVLVGVFWGAPLISRELETGTHRLVWNQTVTRGRWLAVKLGLIGLAVMIATALTAVAVTWWSSSIDQAAVSQFPRLGSLAFDARGIVPIGYAAFVFTLGVVIGMLVRRALPAMAITLAVFVAVQVIMPTLVRPHLLPPTVSTVVISESIVDGLAMSRDADVIRIEPKAPDRGGWLLSGETVDPSGNPITTIPLSQTTACGPGQGGGGGMEDCLADLNRLGYRERLTYHAADRFWPFQWIETGIYLALAAGLAGFCFWWIRRRLT